MRVRRGVPCILALLSIPFAAEASGFVTGTDSVFIPYAGNVANGQLTGSPQINVGFNSGASRVFTMDTGSTGIVVSRDNYTFAPGATPGPAGQITYTSSGIILNGYYYTSTVQISGGASSVTASVPVLVVDSVTCVVNARDCTPDPTPHGVSMFGIGFGQEGSGQPDGTPDKNAFLNVTQINGQSASPSQGYIVGSAGVTIGLTASNTAQFVPASQVALTWSNTLNDWNRTPAYVTAGGVTNPNGQPGTVLPDTGVSYMYLAPYTGADVQKIADNVASGPCVQFGPCAAPGQTITIAFGSNLNSPAFSYSITIAPGTNGAPVASPIAPDWVTVLGTTSDTFVNTSYHFFNAVTYAYDYQGGTVGFVGTSVPEPMSGALLGAGLFGILLSARRRQART